MTSEQLILDAKDGTRPGQRILTLTGPLTIATLFGFQEIVHADKSEALIIDMSGVEYIDSAGLGSIISAYVSREREARQLVLAGVSDRVMMVMTVSGVDRLFQICTSAKEALKLAAGAGRV